MSAAMAPATLRVGGDEIAAADLLAELQYHPAASAAEAMAKARRALVARRLLLDEAARRGLGRDDDAIDLLLEQELDAPPPEEAACRAFHDRHRARFRSPDLVEAQHILVAADPGDPEERRAALARAEGLLREVVAAPERLGALARSHSDCPSRDADGMLGQLARGGAVPELETHLFALEAGETCAIPVPSRYGFHVLRCLARAEGRELPFEHVHAQVARHLAQASWHRALAAFLDALAAKAGVEGLDEVPGGTA